MKEITQAMIISLIIASIASCAAVESWQLQKTKRMKMMIEHIEGQAN